MFSFIYSVLHYAEQAQPRCCLYWKTHIKNKIKKQKNKEKCATRSMNPHNTAESDCLIGEDFVMKMISEQG